MPIVRHPAGSKQGGQFKSAPAPDMASGGNDGLDLDGGSPQSVIVREIANLAVDVKWDAPRPSQWSRTPEYWMLDKVAPASGPLAGCRVLAGVSERTDYGPDNKVQAEWQATAKLTGAGHPGRLQAQIAPLDRSAAWTTPEQAREAVTALLHGDGEGLGWRPDNGRLEEMEPLESIAEAMDAARQG